MPSLPALQRELNGWDDAHTEQTLSALCIESNAGSIPSSSLKWLRPLPASASDEQIRQELRDKGVVHIKGVIPRDLVRDARRRFFETVAPSGVLKPGTAPVDGIFVGGEDVDTTDFVGVDNGGYVGKTPDNCLHAQLSYEAITSEWSNRFCANEHLLEMVRRIQPDWRSPFILRRHLIRSNVPFAKGTSTGVHYDQIFLRAAPPTTLTAWVPIGDCGPMNGGLMYLEGSVATGERIEQGFTELCEKKGMSEEERLYAFNQNMTSTGMLDADAHGFAEREARGQKWLIGDYEAGDAVFHHTYMIHSSARNRDPQGRIRLSADLRFADRERDHDTRWDKHYFPGDGL